MTGVFGMLEWRIPPGLKLCASKIHSEEEAMVALSSFCVDASMLDTVLRAE
jgi:hypothetical protein